MNIVIIRHGEVEYPIGEKGTPFEGRRLVYDGEVPLADTGKLQLISLGTELNRQGINLDALVISPYRRAQESAIALRTKVLVPDSHVYTIDEFRDVDPNSWEGFPIEGPDSYHSIGGDIYSHPRPDRAQQSLADVGLTFNKGLEIVRELSIQHNLNTIGIVSHGDRIGVGRFMMKYGIPPTNYTQVKHEFGLNKGEAIVIRVNDELRSTEEGSVIRVPEVGLGVEWHR